MTIAIKMGPYYLDQPICQGLFMLWNFALNKLRSSGCKNPIFKIEFDQHQDCIALGINRHILR